MCAALGDPPGGRVRRPGARSASEFYRMQPAGRAQLAHRAGHRDKYTEDIAVGSQRIRLSWDFCRN
jgi:hypothetical protein